MEMSGLIQRKSPFSVDETVERLKRTFAAKRLKLFCEIDHSGEAKLAGWDMLPTKLLVFGSPSAGSPLMIASPSLAIDLPLKALIWEDSAAQVWISYNDPRYLQERHGIPSELVQNISGIGSLLESAIASS